MKSIGNLSAVTSVSSVAGILVGVVAIVIILAVITTFIIVVVANRAEPDPRGRRPFTVYLFGVSFITLWTAVLGAVLAVISLVRLIGTYQASGPGIHPVGDSVARQVVLSGLVLVVSLAILMVHLGKGLDNARSDGDPPGPSGRVAQTYVAAVGFVSILVFVVAIIVALYTVFQLIAPGVFLAAGGRTGASRTLIDALFVALVQVAVLMSHRRLASPGLQIFDPRRKGARTEAPAPPAAG